MSGKTASCRAPAQPSRTMHDRRRKPQQMDLFGSGQSSVVIGAAGVAGTAGGDAACADQADGAAASGACGQVPGGSTDGGQS
jgi:hypothetical protein